MKNNRDPIVWVVKEQVRRDASGPALMDFSGAAAYGEVRFITRFDLPMYPASVLYTDWMAKVIEFILEYDDTKDFIVTTGQPTALFEVGRQMGIHGKKPRFLVWKREDNAYRSFIALN